MKAFELRPATCIALFNIDREIRIPSCSATFGRLAAVAESKNVNSMNFLRKTQVIVLHGVFIYF